MKARDSRRLVPYSALLLALLAGCADHPLTDNPPNRVEVAIETETSNIDGKPREVSVAKLLPPAATSIWLVHEPLFSHEAHKTKITARARSSEYKFKKIELTVQIGPIVECSEAGAESSIYPCRGDFAQEKAECDIPGTELPVECVYEKQIAPGDVVTYSAVATLLDSSTVQSPAISFAPGMPTGARLQPIWWHTDFSDAAPAIDRIRVGVFPDPDIVDDAGTFQRFATSVSETVAEAFFNDDDAYAAEYTRNRDLFDLWVGPPGADASQTCKSPIFQWPAATARTGVHAGVVLHWSYFLDCADVVMPGNGSVLAKDWYKGWILVHEAGHFLFGLGDEYKTGGHKSCSTPFNVFKSLKACQDAEGDVPPEESNCKQIPEADAWRVDDSSYEVMDDQTKESRFRDTSGPAVSNQFTTCLTGSCYTGDPTCNDT